MQDIIPSEKRSIRNISIDRQQTTSAQGGTPPESVEPREPLRNSLPPRPLGSNKRQWGRLSLWIGGGVLVLLVIGIIFSTIVSGATVTITPHSATVNLDATVSAYANPGPGELGYTVVTASKEGMREVKATGQESIDRAASGSIIVYNNYDESAQPLIKNTRFQTSDGLIYRIKDSITVPGKHKNEKGELIPGSIETQIFADAPGEKYNIDLTDFTIPGFKESNDPRYESFYARSKTPMTGGFSGVVKTASQEDTNRAQEEIKEELTASLRAEAGDNAPEGFILINETPTISFEELPNGEGQSAEMVTIRMKGNISALAVNSNVLAQYAAGHLIPEYKGEEVRLGNPDSITIERTGNTSNATSTPSGTESINLGISGTPTIVWTYDTEQLKADLAGKSKRTTQAVFESFPGIEKADVVLRPFWKRSMPKDPADIEIQEAPIAQS